jgi:heat shock protein HslJ
VIRKRFVSMALAATLLAAFPAATAAQGDTDPEGVDWALTGYLVGDELVAVPLSLNASLLLEAGSASGSGGCNTFNGSYELDESSLTFDEALSRTLRACPGEVEATEDAYLSSLIDVAAWETSDGGLQLIDANGDALLTFAVPGSSLTPGQLAGLLARMDALQAEIDSVDRRIDNIGIRRLRERIEALEADNGRLRDQIARLGQSSGLNTSSALNAAERVLLEGVPARIAGHCQPLRERLPAGTAAALRCSPNTSLVSDMAYYLMDKGSALKLFRRVMDDHDVEGIGDVAGPDATGCWEGNRGYSFPGGGYIGGIGCYVDGGRANLRIAQEATSCKQLKVGGKQLKRPVMYVAMTGPDNSILRLYEWAMRDKPNNLASGVVVPIERPSGKPSPNCWL